MVVAFIKGEDAYKMKEIAHQDREVSRIFLLLRTTSCFRMSNLLLLVDALVISFRLFLLLVAPSKYFF